jgi:hypothetical protein
MPEETTQWIEQDRLAMQNLILELTVQAQPIPMLQEIQTFLDKIVSRLQQQCTPLVERIRQYQGQGFHAPQEFSDALLMAWREFYLSAQYISTLDPSSSPVFVYALCGASFSLYKYQAVTEGALNWLNDQDVIH